MLRLKVPRGAVFYSFAVMRVMFFIAAFISCYNVAAQQWLQPGAGGGVSHSHLSQTADFYQASPIWGFNGTLKATAGFKYIQAGVALEAGNISGKIVRQPAAQRTDEAAKTLAESATIAGGYMLPHAFVHGKVNLRNSHYVFAGPVAGMMTGRSGVAEQRFASFAYGANLGIVFSLSQRLGLEVAEGWRHTSIDGYNGNKNMQHRLDYFNTNIGVVYSFGK